MRSAVVTSSISRNAGGLFYSVRNLHQHLVLNGVDTRVLALRDEFSEEDAKEWEPLSVEVHEVLWPRALGFSPNMAKSLVSDAPDVVHVHGIWQGPSIASLRFCSKTGRPNVISPRGMLDPWAYRNSRWKKQVAGFLFEFRHLKNASCLNALCESEAQSMREFGLRCPIAIVPNGVELPEFERPRLEGNHQRKSLLFLGRIHPKKGLLNALCTWKSLRDEEPGSGGLSDWQFIIAGWEQGRHKRELETRCEEIGLAYSETSVTSFLQDARGGTDNAASVLFVGPAFGDQKDRLLRRASAFILPSFSEGLPMAVLEAWGYGLPILMTDQCNLPEGFQAGAAIRIGNRPDSELLKSQATDEPPSIVDGLRSLGEMNDSDRHEMGDKGRRLVEERFTWPQVAAQMKELYDWTVGGGECPGFVEQ